MQTLANLPPHGGALTMLWPLSKGSTERWCEAEVHRVAGEVALKSSRSDVTMAEGHFEQALAIARSQAVKSRELRAATSLARLWQLQSKRKEAHGLLAPIYNWFTEGFDTKDLKDAKALIGELVT
jgi:predicted ATPase